MKIVANGETIALGTTETGPTIGIIDYSRRVTDDFGVTTVVERDFARRMSVRFMLDTANVASVQRRLADLRATAATWIADERFGSLAFDGFYKDFEVELPSLTKSYCRLTVEGLAASPTVADNGSDPAASGKPSTLKVLRPTSITSAMLVNSNVPENDPPQWSASATYAKGARVILAATHRVYESGVPGNTGNDPAGTSGKWLDVGPTNRWAMLDEALGTVTARSGLILAEIEAGAAIGAVALLDVIGDSVRVIVTANGATMYDVTRPVAPGAQMFLDLPPVAGARIAVRVIGASGATVSCGTLLVGNLALLGTTEASPSAGITDYSRKEVDDFGAVTIVPRAWAKRMAVKALIRTDAADRVAARIAAVRARPALWIAEDTLDSLTIYGFFKDFSIDVGESTSALSLSIEGLSEAAKVAPFSASVDWPNVGDPLGTKPDDNADVTAENTAADSLKLGGVTAVQIKQDIADAKAAADQVNSDTTAAIEKVRSDLQDEIDAGTAIVNGNIDTIRARIRQGSPNLLRGGDFYDGLNGWTTVVPGSGVQFGSRIGNYAYNNATTTAGALFFRDAPASPGVAYSISAEMFADGTATAFLALQFYSSSASFLASSPNLAGADMNRVALAPVTAPANTAFFRVVAARDVGASGDNVNFARIQVQEGPATDFDPWVNATEIAAGITETKTAIVGINGSLTEYDLRITAAKTSADNANSALAGYDNRITAAANSALAAVQSTQTLSATLGTGNPNVIVNGDGSNGLANWQRTAAASAGYAPTVGSYFDISGPGVFYQDQPIAGGVVWAGSIEGTVVSGGYGIAVQYLDGSGQPIGGQGFGLLLSGWDQRPVGSSAAPTNAASARFLIALNAGDRIQVSRMALQRDRATVWRDPASYRLLQASVSQVASALVDESGARSSLDTRLTAAVDGHSITLQQQAAAIADADGRLQGFWGISFNGAQPVLSAYYRAADGTTQQGVVIGGNLTVLGDALVLGSVHTGAVADFAINGLWSVSAPSFEVSPTLADALVLTVTSTGRPLLIQVGGQADNSTTEIVMALYRDGSGTQIVANRAATGRSMAMIQRIDLPAGTYTFRLKASAVASLSNGNTAPAPSGTSAYVIYPALIVQEVKK